MAVMFSQALVVPASLPAKNVAEYTRAELAAYIKRDYDTWGRVIKAAGITAQ